VRRLSAHDEEAAATPSMEKVKMEVRDRLAFSLNEAGELLGVTRRHLEHEAAAGHLRTLRSGRRRLVTTEALRDYLSDREKTSRSNA
jgi:excisionase family DNA binding protein